MTSDVVKHRQGWRLACGERCLVRRNGKSVECLLVDLSVSGALVSCDDNAFAETLDPGDDCGLFLCGDPHVCPSELVCTVTRRDASRIALRFLVRE